MITKEECFEALDHIWYYGNEKEFALLEQLIEEHFKLLDSRDRWKEIAHNLDEALREYQRNMPNRHSLTAQDISRCSIR